MDRAAASGKMIDFALQFIDAGLYSSVCIVSVIHSQSTFLFFLYRTDTCFEPNLASRGPLTCNLKFVVSLQSATHIYYIFMEQELDLCT
jgi:hypothetical protein